MSLVASNRANFLGRLATPAIFCLCMALAPTTLLAKFVQVVDVSPYTQTEIEFTGSRASIVIFPSLEMNRTAAAEHKLVRGEGFASVVVSINPSDLASQVVGIAPEILIATVTNLLGQKSEIAFTEIVEGDARYYVGSIQAIEGEHLFVDFTIGVDGGESVKRARLRYQHAAWE